jgi:hypothetical protein
VSNLSRYAYADAPLTTRPACQPAAVRIIEVMVGCRATISLASSSRFDVGLDTRSRGPTIERCFPTSAVAAYRNARSREPKQPAALTFLSFVLPSATSSTRLKWRYHFSAEEVTAVPGLSGYQPGDAASLPLCPSALSVRAPRSPPRVIFIRLTVISGRFHHR